MTQFIVLKFSLHFCIYQLAIFTPPSVNIVNTGGDYETGRLVRRFVCPSVCLFVYMYF